MTDEIRFYISIFFRRLHIFLLATILVAGAAAYYAMRLPAVYTSDALLLIEAPSIPDELAASTVRTNPREQLEIIEQRLLTRANLLDISSDLDVFENRDEMFPDQIVNSMRRNTIFEIRTGRDRATIFTISFSARDPETAAAVVNAYVTSVLDENVEIRTGRAGDTMDFFQAEVTRLGEDLARQSQRILNFKNANIDALPESLRYRMDRQTDLRGERADLNRELSSISEQRERLILIFNATGGAGTGELDTRTDEERELDTLRAELEDALSIFTDANPRVRVLRDRVEALEARVAARSDSGGSTEPRPTVLDIQMQELDSRQRRIEDEIAEIEIEMAELEANIDATPGNSVALETLERDYDNLQNQYDLAVRRQSEAATGERIELLSKGERILVLNQPVVPRGPSSPNRQLIMAAGVLAGIIVGGGLVALLEFLNKSIRRPVDISRNLGIVPLATLPRIRTPGEMMRRRAIVSLAVFAVLAAIPVSLYWVHLNVAPVDLLYAQMRERFGL